MANEKRLIDANALVPYLWALFKFFGSIPCTEADKATQRGIKRCIGEIKKVPTVDAVEVVHGHWNVDDYDSGEPDGYAAFIEVHCSECGYELGAESGQYGWAYGDPFPLNYCPNCGAKMDGDGNA